tara:strand:+ start:412 stop:588 length:177 start_codon:yes stop_codon:yes gene_type:complete
MNLEQAIQLVLEEAESSAIGDVGENPHSQSVISAIELVQSFYEEHGHHFSNFSLDKDC